MTTAAKAERELAPWVERLARLGYATKGAVYIIIGVLAFQAAFGLGGRTTDSSGALAEILQQPFGRVLLFAVALGLAGYLLWRLSQGLLDVEHKGTGAGGLLKRAGYVLSGLAYGSLGLSALQLALGMGFSSSGDGSEIWTARLLGVPWGRWLVGLIGLAAFALAVNAGYVALSGMFKKKLKLDEMDEATQHTASVLGRVGLIARGVVLAVIGWLFIQAAYQANAAKAGDSSDALSALEQGPYGPWILGVVAVGVICYGIYALFQARYRKISLD